MKGFGDRLRTLREEYGFTQKQLAKALVQAQSTIAYWENDKKEPSISALKRICDFFDKSADYMLGMEDDLGQKIPCDLYKLDFTVKGVIKK